MGETVCLFCFLSCFVLHSSLFIFVIVFTCVVPSFLHLANLSQSFHSSHFLALTSSSSLHSSITHLQPPLTLSSPHPPFLFTTTPLSTFTSLTILPHSTSVTRLHPNTQQAFFRKLTSVVYLHRRFFWTDGKEVLTEELNNGTFYHNRCERGDGATGMKG